MEWRKVGRSMDSLLVSSQRVLLDVENTLAIYQIAVVQWKYIPCKHASPSSLKLVVGRL